MILAQSIAALQRDVARRHAAGQRVAFVPTLGNLHAGHLQLVQEARRHAEAVVVSIYVNPLQFGNGEDYTDYPRTPERDQELLRQAGADLLFLPDDAAIYPRGRDACTRIEVPGISDTLCGAARPGHFRGVATVVHRLFQIVQPDVALFGKKDYQQLLVIRLMTADLGLPVEIVGVDTVRAEDGLALSSRNAYLTTAERRVAAQLYGVLQFMAKEIVMHPGSEGGYAEEEVRAQAALTTAGFRPDYLSVRRQADLAVPGPVDRKLVILAAAWLGRARLIDNLEIDLKPGV